MRYTTKLLLPVIAASFFCLPSCVAHSQITTEIRADLHHSFTIGNATLPPGVYLFQMIQGSDLTAMLADNVDGNSSVEFLVGRSVDSHIPRHSELVFDRYGKKEFLMHIYQAGNKSGVTVLEPSRIMARLQKEGEKPFEHTEEQN